MKKAWFSYAADARATLPPKTAWDAVPICEQQWSATLVIPVFTAGMPAKLTRDQLRRHAGGKSPGGTGGYVADSLAAYDNQP